MIELKDVGVFFFQFFPAKQQNVGFFVAMKSKKERDCLPVSINIFSCQGSSHGTDYCTQDARHAVQVVHSTGILDFQLFFHERLTGGKKEIILLIQPADVCKYFLNYILYVHIYF